MVPTLESILNQTVVNLELLAIDDGSTDGSRDILQTLEASDPRVQVILHAENRRAPVARNSAIAAARGEFIAFQNHDDRAAPARLERQIEFLRLHPEHGAVVSGVSFEDPQGRAIGDSRVPPLEQLDLRWEGLMECPFHISTLMVRASLLRENPSLRFDPELTHRSDYGFSSLLLSVTTVGVIPEILVRYVLHPSSVSRLHTGTMQRQADIIAHRAIQRELPGHLLSLAEVTEMRGIVLHLPGDFSRGLAATKRAWDHYWALFTAYRAKHAGLASRPS